MAWVTMVTVTTEKKSMPDYIVTFGIFGWLVAWMVATALTENKKGK